MNSTTCPWDYINSLGIHFYSLNDDVLINGDKSCKPYEKIICKKVENINTTCIDLNCCSKSCNMEFNTATELDIHQWTKHMHICQICKGVFPSHYFLELHILEFHDSFFTVASQKKPMYSCLLEDCGQVFHSPQLRKEHCMKVHKFPSDFRYNLKFRKCGAPKRSKQEGEKFQKGKQHSNFQVDSNEFDLGDEMECTTGEEIDGKSVNDTICDAKKLDTCSAKVPKSLSFGIGVPRTFLKEREKGGRFWHQRGKGRHTQVNIENVSMRDLNETLEAAMQS